MSEGYGTKKWTKEELSTNLKLDCDYNSAVSIAALYKKIYGEFPKIGLSGFQASCADELIEVMPDTEKGIEDEI